MNEELARRAKARAARAGQSFTQAIEEAVSQWLAKPSGRRDSPRPKIVLPVAGDPQKRITHEQYRKMIDQMYEEDAEFVRRGCK